MLAHICYTPTTIIVWHAGMVSDFGFCEWRGDNKFCYEMNELREIHTSVYLRLWEQIVLQFSRNSHQTHTNPNCLLLSTKFLWHVSPSQYYYHSI